MILENCMFICSQTRLIVYINVPFIFLFFYIISALQYITLLSYYRFYSKVTTYAGKRLTTEGIIHLKHKKAKHFKIVHFGTDPHFTSSLTLGEPPIKGLL